MYQKLFSILNKYFKKSTLFKVLFNWSPMYRRSCGKISFVSEDLHTIRVKIPLSYRNKNYVGSIFGGSLFAATDPIYMIQLVQILGKDYVVWDKASTIRFKKPAFSTAFVNFEFTPDEIIDIQTKVAQDNEVNHIKLLTITDGGEKIFSEIEKTIYISSKSYYKQKLQQKQQ